MARSWRIKLEISWNNRRAKTVFEHASSCPFGGVRQIKSQQTNGYSEQKLEVGIHKKYSFAPSLDPKIYSISLSRHFPTL